MEQWKFVQKSNGKKAVEYWVSDQGRIKSVYSKSGKFIIRSGSSCRSGYKICAIGWVHRIVAKAFVPNPLNLPEIDHIDGNPSNNAASNLRWCTHKDNMHNPLTLAKKRMHKNEKTVKRVRQFSLDGQFIKDWKSCYEIARAFGVSRGRVNTVMKKDNPIWHGYKWKRVLLTVPRYKDYC